MRFGIKIGIFILLASCTPKSQLYNGKLEDADYWRDEPMILSAGLGFDKIIGLETLNEDEVRAAGGSWYSSLRCSNGEEPSDGMRTSAATTKNVETFFLGTADHDDGLPVVFSWPVAGETLDPEDFRLTLNTGDKISPRAAGLWPNFELNERNVVVLFGEFGNRGLPDEPDAIFPVKVEVVDNESPLILVGPGGQEVSAVGLSWETDSSPYESGPYLVGAKLNRIEGEPSGEGGVSDRLLTFIPNDETTLYAEEGDFRLRMLTSGGFSPDGVTGITPDQFETFFRIHALAPDGQTLIIDRQGVDYDVKGGRLKVIGLSDLGSAADPDEGVYYDDCYSEDHDNYIDIILSGDDEAARNILYLEIPAIEGGYAPFYNPGGPGPEPYEDVRYTAPGPRDLEPVIIALDDPMRVSRK